jgi:glycosyltransferase involved in cell wall biosynthesis
MKKPSQLLKSGVGAVAKIALIDLLFHWPPSGGSWVDLVNVGTRLQEEGHQVRLFCPSMTRYFPRGKMDQKPPLAVEVIPVKWNDFTPEAFGPVLRTAVDAFSPDLVFFGDGYMMKPPLLPYLSHYPIIVRFYAHEVVCLNVRHFLFREGKTCLDGNFLLDPARCHACFYNKPWTEIKHRAAMRLGMRDRGRALHLSHEYLYSGAGKECYRDNLNKWLKLASALVVYNKEQEARLKPIGAPIFRIASGIDCKLFGNIAPPSADKEKPLRVLLAGRGDDPLKGLHILEKASDILKSRGLKIDPMASGIKDCNGSVKPLPWKGQEELASLYEGADVIVAPTLWEEPFGIAVVEAMAAGRPVIASATGGMLETIVDNETGFHIPLGDADALADKLEQYANDRAMLQAHGQAARARARAHFDARIVWNEQLYPLIGRFL